MLTITDPASLPFGPQLDWHLLRGTRADGSPQSKGVPWTNKDFARAVGAKSTEGEKNERTIRNWRNDETAPNPADLHAMLLVLFGSNPNYAEWRSALTEKYHTARGEDQDEQDAPTTSASLPTKPFRCLGRDDDLKSVVEALTAASERTAVLVLGGPGMGKTTLTRQAASEAAVIERFGNRRWFVELENATDARTFETAVIAALGLDPTSAKFSDALAHHGQAPGLLLLDNLETPWEADHTAIEARLAALHRIPALTLLASIRGNEPPAGLRWSRQRTMHPLESPHDRDLFLDIAQDIKPDDPHLAPLLAELGGVPLAVELVAMQAAPGDTLAAIHEQWQRVGTALAQRRGVEPSRLSSLEISLELSFGSHRMGHPSRRLFSILAQLPAGIGAEDLNALFRDAAFDARHDVLACGLAYERAGRLDLMPPVRDHGQRLHPPDHADASLWRSHFLGLARDHGDRIATAEGAGATQRLAAELPNIDAALRAAIHAGAIDDGLAAIYCITLVMRLTGLGIPASIRDLASACRKAANVRGEANCIKSIGDIALGRSEHHVARTAYEQALPLYRQVGSIRGEATCVMRLGEIALERSEHAVARAAFEAALPLYRQVGGILGEANCTMRLGEIALERSEHGAALTAFEQALPLYRKAGDILGEANCIVGLGDVALRRGDHDAARKAYEQALPLYRKVGALLGEANCIQRLGDIALAGSDRDAALAAYDEALALYERIRDPYSIGLAHARLARATTGEVRARHLAAARSAWESIDRPDLVASLEE